MTSTTDSPALTRGHKKKARTRQLLVETALEVLAERGEAFSVSDVAARAGVSAGTFYNYFDDKEALLGELVPTIVGAFALEAAQEVDEADPVRRVALISAVALHRAAAAPEAVRAAFRLEAVQQAFLDGSLVAHLRADLGAGHRAGRFSAAPDTATVDVVIGGLFFAARRMAGGDDARPYRVGVLTHLLQSLGVPYDEAAAVAADVVAEVGSGAARESTT